MSKVWGWVLMVSMVLLSSCGPGAGTPTLSDTVPPTSIEIPVPAFTPSPIPTYPLDLLRDKLPATPPADGFVVLELPASVDWNGLITVTILTVPAADCRILYWGTNGLSHAKDLDPQIADANGICSWTWKQAQVLGGKNEGSLPLRARISITADGRWGEYYITVK